MRIAPFVPESEEFRSSSAAVMAQRLVIESALPVTAVGGMSYSRPGGKIPLGLKRKGLRISGVGFVGSHLVDRLMARGDSVIVAVQPLMLEVDQIYHLACPASPVHYKFNYTL